MKLSVIIPCFNEKDFIEEIIKRIRKVNIEKEIIVIDDGSADGTKEKLQRIKPQIDVLEFSPVNRGKGAAVRQGIERES